MKVKWIEDYRFQGDWKEIYQFTDPEGDHQFKAIHEGMNDYVTYHQTLEEAKEAIHPMKVLRHWEIEIELPNYYNKTRIRLTTESEAKLYATTWAGRYVHPTKQWKMMRRYSTSGKALFIKELKDGHIALAELRKEPNPEGRIASC